MKKLKPILGISLLVQSVTFFILSLVNVEKRKNLAKAFGIFSALGGVAGTALLVSEYNDRKAYEAEFDAEDYFDEILDDLDELDIDEDDISCSFTGEETESEENA